MKIGTVLVDGLSGAVCFEEEQVIEAEVEGLGLPRNQVQAVKPDPRFTRLIDLGRTAPSEGFGSCRLTLIRRFRG